MAIVPVVVTPDGGQSCCICCLLSLRVCCRTRWRTRALQLVRDVLADEILVVAAERHAQELEEHGQDGDEETGEGEEMSALAADSPTRCQDTRVGLPIQESLREECKARLVMGGGDFHSERHPVPPSLFVTEVSDV